MEQQKRSSIGTIAKVVCSILILVATILIVYKVNYEKEKIPDERVVTTAEPEPTPVICNRTYSFETDEQSNTISNYIRLVNPRIPIIVADFTSITIIKKSNEYGIPVSLIVAIIEKESVFDPSATSTVKIGGVAKPGAAGLMQIYDASCGEVQFDKSKIYNIDYNLDCGCIILLDKLKTAKGDLNKALYLYVGGDSQYANDVLTDIGKFILYVNSKIEKDEDVKVEVK